MDPQCFVIITEKSLATLSYPHVMSLSSKTQGWTQLLIAYNIGNPHTPLGPFLFFLIKTKDDGLEVGGLVNLGRNV